LPWSRSFAVRLLTHYYRKRFNAPALTSLCQCIIHWSSISSAWLRYIDNHQSVKKKAIALWQSTEQENSADVFWRSLCSWNDMFDSWAWRFSMTSERLRLPAVLLRSSQL
jgi:hypothetical protein